MVCMDVDPSTVDNFIATVRRRGNAPETRDTHWPHY